MIATMEMLVPESPAGRPLNIADHVRLRAEVQPHDRAVVVPRFRDRAGRRGYTHWTFAQLNRCIDGYARGLAVLGVTRGMRVLLMVEPSLEFFGLTFALLRMGAVVVLIDPAMGRIPVLGAILEVEPEAFIAVPRGHVARMLFPQAFSSVRISVIVGPKWFLGGVTLDDVVRLGEEGDSSARADTHAGDLAAILFTSGSTGAPKGVLYTHGIFDAQVRIFSEEFGIEAREIDLSAFPLFSLFSVALGVTVIVPDMDATRPAFVDGAKILEAVEDQGVTYAFGSPAFWHRVAGYCEEKGRKLTSVRRVLMAGAPAPLSLLERLERLIAPSADIFTPYGATECLPITLPSARELLRSKGHRTREGRGTCVGRPMPETSIKIIEITDAPIEHVEKAQFLPPGNIGEICVSSPVTTQGYFRRPDDDAASKIRDGARSWHRMGDVGWVDEDGDLWFCGRKSHRVGTPSGTLFSVCTEAIFNEHPSVYRSALVGIGEPGQEEPVIIVECRPEQAPRSSAERRRIAQELRELGAARFSDHPSVRSIEKVLFHPSFPVDARHNAKIRREVLRGWARKQIERGRHR